MRGSHHIGLALGKSALLWAAAALLAALAPGRGVDGNGRVTFQDVTSAAGIRFVNAAAPEKRYIVESMGGGVALFDFDHDGRLDIYLVNSYTVEAALEGRPRPRAALYRNRGDGTFEDVAEKAGVADPGWAMGVAVADYDNDGLDDLYVTCFGPNRLYHNRGDGTFEDVTARAGVGDARFSTGAAWGDYDRDGLLDLFVANYVDFKLNDLPQFGKGPLCQYRGVPVQCGPRGLAGAGDTLYHNNGDGTFADVSRRSKTADASMPYVGWGTKLFDYDNDGWLDLFVCNGHVYPQIEGAYPEGYYRQRKLLYRNLRNGTFAEVAASSGKALLERRASRGAAFGDFDEDGDVDIVVNDLDGPPMLLRNEGGNRAGHWISLLLTGTKSNRNAVGARVRLKVGDLVQVDEVRSGDSYLSHSDWRLHFGLGTAAVVDEIAIQWPSGRTESLRKVKADRVVSITEGKTPGP